jgi:hypothetical protein
MAVRQAEGASQVQPISSASASRSMFPKRVEPTARPVARSTVAQAT